MTPPLPNVGGLSLDWVTIAGHSEWDEYFVVPANWPPRLPLPCKYRHRILLNLVILRHLVDVFFKNVPILSRILHRPTFLTRLLLPTTDRDFPQPCLLHAICSVAAPYTAWVNHVLPEMLETTVHEHLKRGMNLEDFEDFCGGAGRIGWSDYAAFAADV